MITEKRHRMNTTGWSDMAHARVLARIIRHLVSEDRFLTKFKTEDEYYEALRQKLVAIGIGEEESDLLAQHPFFGRIT